MSVYAIGDLQGCLDPFKRLLRRLRFDPRKDRLLLTGDLVNRGPQSLETLRFVMGLGSAAVTVLGNHDLHLLAAAAGGKLKDRDTLEPLLRAPDRDQLLAWLRAQPLAYEEPRSGVLLVHAGVPPQWTRRKTLQLAREVSTLLQSARGPAFFARMYGNEPARWRESLRGAARARFVINCLTRMRYCTPDGAIDLQYKGAPGSQPAHLVPWFQAPGRKTARDTIVFGHWSALGLLHDQNAGVWGLDSGCVWGGCLSALDVQTGRLVRTRCAQYQKSEGE